MGRYPHLVRHRRRWMVRLIVPADVRSIIGQSVFKISTGETDEHRAVAKAGAIIAALKGRIEQARMTLKTPIEARTEELASAFRARNATDPATAQAFVLTEVIGFVLQEQGHTWADYGRQVQESGYDVYAGLRLLPKGDTAAAFEGFAQAEGLDYSNARLHIQLYVHWDRCVASLEKLQEQARRDRRPFHVPGLRTLLRLAGVVERRGGVLPFSPPPLRSEVDAMPETVAELQKLVQQLRSELRQQRATIGTLRMTVRDLDRQLQNHQ